jgi:hypothetical protein
MMAGDQSPRNIYFVCETIFTPNIKLYGRAIVGVPLCYNVVAFGLKLRKLTENLSDPANC